MSIVIVSGKYFTGQELNPHNLPYNDEQAANLSLMISKLDPVRVARGKAMIVISGLRDIGIQTKVNPLNMGSNHLKGLAVDIYDEGGNLLDFVLQNLGLMKSLGFYFEHPNWTPTWIHFQPVRPISGHRFFVPNSSPALCNRWDGTYDKAVYDS